MIRFVLGLKQPLFYLWFGSVRLPSPLILEPSIVASGVGDNVGGLADPSGELIQRGLLTCVFRYETDEPKCTADASLAGLSALVGHRPARPPGLPGCACVFLSPPPAPPSWIKRLARAA